MALKNDILWRVAIVYILVVIVAALIGGKILYLQLFQGNAYEKKSKKMTLKTEKVEANRGDIKAAEAKKLLATSVPHYEIRVDFLSDGLNKSVISENIDELAIRLAHLFGDKTALQYKMDLMNARRNGNRFYLLKNWVSYDELEELKTFPIFKRGRYKGGFIALKKNKRIRPHGMLAARTIGYTTKGESGNVVGIEGAYDHLLRGSKGLRLMRRTSGGGWMPVSDNNQVDPQDGKDVVTTLNIDFQDVAQSALLRQLRKHKARHGTAVLMEVETGAIKAIANLKRTDEGSYDERYNYAIGESTEPGSTFKLPAIMAAIEDGYVDLDDTIHTGDGSVQYYDHTIEDSKEGGHGKISVQEVIEVSSNVGMSKIITENYRNQPTRFVDRLYRMHLNEKFGLKIKGEGKPHIKYPGDQYWSGITLPMMAFGYEVRLTPLQLLTFYNAIANDGKMMKPMFVKKIQYHGETLENKESEVIDPSITSNSTIEKAQRMLKGVVKRGTAENLNDKNYQIAGKTGTVELANRKYGYRDQSKTSYQASFVGYFPAEDPEYSCIVVVNSPSKNVYYGNIVAGPVFKEIADKVYAYSQDLYQPVGKSVKNKLIEAPYTKPGIKSQLFGVLEQLDVPVKPQEVTSKWVATNQQKTHVDCNNIYIDNEQIPNVKGMGAKDATYLLEKIGLDVQIDGRGTVVRQSIQPGRPVKAGDDIKLTMSFSN